MSHISCEEVLPFLEPGWVGIEIGVAQGWSSEAFIKHGIRFMYLIDPWWGDQGDTGDWDGSWNYFNFRKRMAPYSDKYATFRMPSAEAERFVPMVDFVFVDGNHAYEYVKSDLEFYWPKIKPGGILCGHDYTNNDTCQVARAVDEFAARHSRRVEVAAPCWVIYKE